jgi:hypothetical protein
MIDDFAVVLLVNAVEFAGLGLVDQIEEGWKRVAEVEAPAAAVADVEDLSAAAGWKRLHPHHVSQGGT